MAKKQTHVTLNEDEKKHCERASEDMYGWSNVSAYIRYLVRQDMK